MKRVFVVLFAVVVCCSLAYGQSDNAASRAAASWSTGLHIPRPDGRWHTILQTDIKSPGLGADLFLTPSLVTTLRTDVPVAARLIGLVSSGEADSGIQVRVLVDGNVAHPGPVMFDKQLLSLTDRLQGFIGQNCRTTTVTEPVFRPTLVTVCTCRRNTPPFNIIPCAPPPAPVPAGFTRTCRTVTRFVPTGEVVFDTDQVCTIVPGVAPEPIDVLLEETEAHSFTFIANDVGVGNHIVQVQAKVTLGRTTINDRLTPTARALLGPGSLTVEAVNLK